MKIIKTLLILSIAVLLQTTASASPFFGKTIRSSGDDVTKTFSISSSSYTKIGVSSIANVKIIEGSGDIVVKIDSNLASYLVMEVRDNVLKIGLKGKLNFRGNFTFDVVVPCGSNLEGISASASADVVSEVVLNGDNIELSASSGADLSAITSGGECNVRASSGSDISVECKSETLIVKASSGADIVVNMMSSRCEARSSSGSDITLTGEASHVDLRASSGSDIHARDLTFETSSVSESSGADVRLQKN